MKKLRVEACVPGPANSVLEPLGDSARSSAATSKRSHLSGWPPVVSSATRDSNSAVKAKGGASHIGSHGNLNSRARNVNEPHSRVSSKPSRVPAGPPCSAHSRNASFVVRRNAEDEKAGGMTAAHPSQFCSHADDGLGDFPREESASMSIPTKKAERGPVPLGVSDEQTRPLRGAAQMEACRQGVLEAESYTNGSAPSPQRQSCLAAPSIHVQRSESIQERMSSKSMTLVAPVASPGNGQGNLSQNEEVHVTPEQKGQGRRVGRKMTQELLSPPGTEPSVNIFSRQSHSQRMADLAACDYLDARNLPDPADQLDLRLGGVEGLETLEARVSWQQGASVAGRSKSTCRGPAQANPIPAGITLNDPMAPASPSLLSSTPIREQQPFPVPGSHPGKNQLENLGTQAVVKSEPDPPNRTMLGPSMQRSQVEEILSVAAEPPNNAPEGGNMALVLDGNPGPLAASALEPPVAPAMSNQGLTPPEKSETSALPAQLPQPSKTAPRAPPPPPPPPSKSRTSRPPPPPKPPGSSARSGPPPPPPPPGKGRGPPGPPPPRKATGSVEPVEAPAPSKPMVKLFWEKLPPYQVN